MPPTPTYIQGNTAGDTSPGTTSVASFSSNITAGNLIIVAFSALDINGVVQSITDTQGNTYSTAVTRTVSASLGVFCYIFYTVANSSGANTITVTVNDLLQYRRLLIHEYSNIDTLDVGVGTTGASGIPTSTPTNTNYATELIFGWGITNGGTTIPGAGFTLRGTAISESTEDKVVTSTGSYSAFYINQTEPWICQMATFYKASAYASTNTATISWLRA